MYTHGKFSDIGDTKSGYKKEMQLKVMKFMFLFVGMRCRKDASYNVNT